MPETHPPLEQQILSREFELAGTLDALPPARAAIMQFVRQYCSDEQQEIDILIALQEALANAILHGCHKDGSKVVKCRVEISPESIELVVRDPGSGFDTAGATDVAEDGTNLTQHGRGIHLMRSLLDEVSYRHNGAELHLRKLRSSG